MKKLHDKKFKRFNINHEDLILDGMMDGKQGEKLSLIVPQTNLNMVTQLCMMLASVLDATKEPITEPHILEAVFIECVYWSIGGTLVEESQGKYQFTNVAN